MGEKSVINSLVIEVEKKFRLCTGDGPRLTRRAEFLGQEVFTDIYFDDSNFSLISRDIWLRARDGKFELKLPLDKARASERVIDRYDELKEGWDIRKALKLGQTGTFREALQRARYEPFVSLKTTRRRYKNGDFTIVFDSMDYGYQLAEVEIMVEDAFDMEKATERILGFARKNGLSLKPPRGKLLEYFYRKDPKIFKMLVEEGVA